jgi:hypothetical protein
MASSELEELLQIDDPRSQETDHRRTIGRTYSKEISIPKIRQTILLLFRLKNHRFNNKVPDQLNKYWQQFHLFQAVSNQKDRIPLRNN